MKTIIFLLLVTSCSQSKMQSREPASLFKDSFKGEDGKARLLATIYSYAEEVKKIQNSSNPEERWFKACGKKPPKNYSVKDALECHDIFASSYFMDINYMDIYLSLEKSDQNTIKNNFYMYPAVVIKHYMKIAEGISK